MDDKISIAVFRLAVRAGAVKKKNRFAEKVPKKESAPRKSVRRDKATARKEKGRASERELRGSGARPFTTIPSSY
ncbi:MAG: hypothetical protein LUE08_03090 [Akkermansiaceae bacterium]|nr:hypothetical protein [Akkermansiaceae bacterium]